MNPPVIIATRGSALALAQASKVLDLCRASLPAQSFELRIIRTTGDKLQSASMAKPAPDLPKGLFTKELEVALLSGEADLAVHSLKDLPTELPHGLDLGAVGERADVRDVLICRDAGCPFGEGFKTFHAGITLEELPDGVCVATSSTRRQAQLKEVRPGLITTEIRGNVLTRLQKLASWREIDATLLAAAGLARLGYSVDADGLLRGEGVPGGLRAIFLEIEQMLPCVGQAALGIEIRSGDGRIAKVCSHVNHAASEGCVKAERSFLRAMGGGCQSPVAAYGEMVGGELRLRAVSFVGGSCLRGELTSSVGAGEDLGREMAVLLKK